MTVTSIDETSKREIYDAYIIGGGSIASLAKTYKTSTRTIGRVIAEMREAGDDDDSDNYFRYENEHQFYDDDDEFDSADEPVKFDQRKYGYTYFLTRKTLTLTRIDVSEFGAQSEPKVLNISIEQIDRDLLQHVLNEDKDAMGMVWNKFDVKSQIDTYQLENITVMPKEGKVYFTDEDGQKYDVAQDLCDRILEQLNKHKNVDNLVRFASKLAMNPSFRAVNELYSFLKANDIEITDEGMVKCFKRVSDDYKDIYTNTFDNSPGKTVKMKRSLVNEDPNQTCSNGLHVCSKAYLPSYPGARTVAVLVHPKDFVSVPVDYYSIGADGAVQAKARVCEYTVLADVTDEINL